MFNDDFDGIELEVQKKEMVDGFRKGVYWFQFDEPVRLEEFNPNLIIEEGYYDSNLDWVYCFGKLRNQKICVRFDGEIKGNKLNLYVGDFNERVNVFMEEKMKVILLEVKDEYLKVVEDGDDPEENILCYVWYQILKRITDDEEEMEIISDDDYIEENFFELFKIYIEVYLTKDFVQYDYDQETGEFVKK